MNLRLKIPFRLLYPCFLLFIVFETTAQKQIIKQIHLNRENNSVRYTKVLQSRDGFLWFGSSEGLYMFDGSETKLFSFSNTDFDNTVSALYQDRFDTIWIGYQSGKLAYIKDYEIKLFQPEEGLPKKAITSLTKDKNENLWLTTAGEGVYYYFKNRFYNINTDDGLNDNYTNASAPDDHGNMWIGTDEGLALCSNDRERKVLRSFHKQDGLPDNIVRVIVPDGLGNIWLGFQEMGFCKFLERNNKFIVPEKFSNWSYGQINTMDCNKSELWIGTEENGVICFTGNETFMPDPLTDNHSLPDSKISDIKLDAEGNSWIVVNSSIFQSFGNRLLIFDKADEVSMKMIHTLMFDSGGNMWFTPDQGLCVYFPSPIKGKKIKKYTITPPEKLIDIVSLYEDECHYLWIGTMGAGLYRLNSINGKIRKISGINLPENASIMSVKGKGNVIWLGTLGGALKLTLTEDCNSDFISPQIESLAKVEELGRFYIYDVFVDSKNRVWFGTDGKGITCLDQERYINFNEKDGIKSNVIYSITEDESGNIWFSTIHAGIYKYNGATFKNYNLQDGLRNLSISSILPDGNGNIIIVHKHGLDVLNTKTEGFLYYGIEAGMTDMNSDLNSIDLDRFGNIWIGTDDGIIRYQHQSNQYLTKPLTIITKASLFTNELKQDINRKLAYDQNYLSFDFTGLWYSNPERVKYQYILEGYNREWITTSDRKVIFPNLAPGNYNFKIRTSLHNNFRNYTEASYIISIGLPYWRENWFIFLILISVSGLIYTFVRLRIMQIRRMEALKKEKIEFQFETLKNQVNPHFLFNSFNTLITTIEEDKEAAIEYTETLSAFFRNIVSYKDHDLITLQEELDIVSNYFFLQQKRYGNNLKLEIQVSAEARKRKIPPLVLQLLLENAVKHNAISSETPLKIVILSTDSQLEIKNNINPKRTMEPSTKTGLQNIINRYKLLTEKTVVVRQEQDWFIVIIPLILEE